MTFEMYKILAALVDTNRNEDLLNFVQLGILFLGSPERYRHSVTLALAVMS